MMPAPLPRQEGQIDCIEVLRALAVIAVVLHHLRGGLLTLSNPVLVRFYDVFNGTGGVDLFFAVSGFVIMRSLLPQLTPADRGWVYWRTTLAFWMKRAGRLLPTAWLWLAIILIAARYYNTTTVFGSVETNVDATLAAIFNVANFRFADAFGRYFYGASFVYWSLSLEWQFYLLLPVAIRLLGRWLPHALGLLVLWQFFSDRSLLLMMVRTDAILLGVLLAIGSRRPVYRRLDPGPWLKWPAVPPAFALLLLVAVMTIPAKFFKGVLPFPMGLVALVSAALVWLGSYDHGYIMPAGRLKKIFCWIGSRSYAIYVIHIPVFYTVRESWHRAGAAKPDAVTSVIVAALAIILLSELNYRLVERPLRRKGAALARRIQSGARPPNLSVAGQAGGVLRVEQNDYAAN